MTAKDDDSDVLRSERDQAMAHARRLEHELGALRGRVNRYELIMWRRTVRRRQLAKAARLVLGRLPGRSRI